MMANPQMAGMMGDQNQQYYFVPNASQAVTPAQMQPPAAESKMTPQSAMTPAPTPAAQAPAPAAARPKRRGLLNKKISKDGTAEESREPPVEKAAPHERRYYEGDSLSQHEFCEMLGDANGMYQWSIAEKAPDAQAEEKKEEAPPPARKEAPSQEPLANLPGRPLGMGQTSSTADSRSMIKALNLQPISAPSAASAKARGAAQRGKDGGAMQRAEE